MNLTIIVAFSENNIIGNGNEIPWRKTKENRERYREDMQRFQELTINHDVIMGRTTYESIPQEFRPLKDRRNIILTSNLDYNPSGVFVAHSIKEALDLCESDKSYIAGGKSVYRQFLPLAKIMEITKIHAQFEGDVFFPEPNWEEWTKINEKNRRDYSFLTYIRT